MNWEPKYVEAVETRALLFGPSLVGVLGLQRLLYRAHPVFFGLRRDFAHPANLPAGLFHLGLEHHRALGEFGVHDMGVMVGERRGDDFQFMLNPARIDPSP